MKQYCWFLAFAFCFFGRLQAEPPVKLQFTPQVPVVQTNEVVIEMRQSLPGVKLETTSREVFQAVVKVIDDQTGMAIAEPPIDLSYMLKNAKIELKINDREVKYDTQEPAVTVESAELSKLVDKPIKLRFEEGFALAQENPELTKLLNDFQVLQDIDLRGVLKEIFIYVFALAGKDLKVGANFQVDFPSDLTANVPIRVNYEVVKIDDQIIQANMTASIDAKSIKLEKSLELHSGKLEEIAMSLNGKVTGKATWNRSNALLHDTDTAFTLTGTLKIAQLEWPLNVSGTISVKSVLYRP